MEWALKQQTADLFKYVLICACAYPNSVHDVQWNGNKDFGSVPHKARRAFAASVDDYMLLKWELTIYRSGSWLEYVFA